jgi:hypothetical protein
MGLLDKAKGFGTGLIVGRILKGAAEGKFGPQAKWIYWHLRGLKTVIGIVSGLAAGVLALLQSYGVCDFAAAHYAWVACGAWSDTLKHWLALNAGFWIWLGQQDGALHLEAPDPYFHAPDDIFLNSR